MSLETLVGLMKNLNFSPIDHFAPAPAACVMRALILLRAEHFSPLEFQVRQWRSRADRVLTLNMNIRLSLFWSTWSLSRARGPDSATVTWRIGSDYSFYIASEQKCLDWLGHSSCDSLNCRKY